MFLFHNQKVFINLLIEVLLILCENGLLIKRSNLTVAANGTSSASRPFLQIEKRTITRLTITKPHIPHYLSCIATIEETYDYQNIYYYTWYRNDIEIVRRNDYQTFNNGTLRLPTNERASGVYRCKINANTTAVLSESITVEFPVLKRVAAMSNVTAVNDMSFTLNCPVISVPAANISWYYGNVSLTKYFKENSFLILTNGSLVLRRLTSKSAGKYKCLAQNQYALKTHRQFIWTLRINNSQQQNTATKRNTQLIPYLQNATQYIPNGTKLQLRCSGVVENITIEWWYQRTLKVASIKVSNNSEVYSIDSATVDEHEGYYTCTTKADKQQFNVVVTVPPSIVDELPTQEGRITASYTLHCRTQGNPRPTLSWYHNGAALNSSYTHYIDGNNLSINSFDPDENGIYQCFARNIAGEVYTAGEIRFRNNANGVITSNPLKNIRCYAHSFNTINITFESDAADLAKALFIVHIVKNEQHRWTSPIAPMELKHNSYVVLSSNLPVYRPFELITRVLYPTQVRNGYKEQQQQQQAIRSSLRSMPVTCCTQGMLLHLVHMGNNTFVTWSQPEMYIKKYFILQYSINHTHPHPQQLLAEPLRGTMEQVELNEEDVTEKLTNIPALNETAARDVLQHAESKFNDNEVRAAHLESDEDIFNIVVPASVTGILMANFLRIKLRVLIITKENENLEQDFRYVQWKIIENDTSEVLNTPFRLKTVESRLLVFHFLDGFNETCVQICKLIIPYPIIRKEEPKCEQRNIVNSQLILRSLKPSSRYRLHFYSCESELLYGQLDVRTLPDPPGTISNQRVTRQNGLKLSWDPPIQPNGRVHHYNIHWTLGNVTHEAIVLECSSCFYKFPNISETAKINVTVRVVGETGVGAPIYIDLRNINHHTLEIERSTSNTEVYSGIAIGSLLSTFCVFFFALLIILQRKRFKTRQQGPTHLSTTTDINFGNLSNTTLPGDSAGGLSGSTIQQDCHEMQTLIPKSRRNIILLAETRLDQQISLHPNGNGKLNNSQISAKDDDMSVLNETIANAAARGNLNTSQMPLCTSTPERESKPFFIAFKQQTPPNTVAAPPKHSSSTAPFRHNSGINDTLTSSNSLTLKVAANVASLKATQQQRSGSLTSTSSTGNSSSGSSSKKQHQQHQFQTNFPKHSNSIDGICLLAEEDSAASITPTTELDINKTTLTNGFSKAPAPATAPAPASAASTMYNARSKNTQLNLTSVNDLNATVATAALIHSTKKLPMAQNSQYISKVPAIDGSTIHIANRTPRMQPNHTNLRANAIPTPILTSTLATSTSTSTATRNTNSKKPTTTNAKNKLQRRPNVDPNG